MTLRVVRIVSVLRYAALSISLALPISALAAAAPVDFAGSSWSGSALFSAKISGVGALKGPVTFDLDFGTQADPLLAANEFLMVLDDGFVQLPLVGTWSLDAKGRLILVLDTDAFGADFLALLADLCDQLIGSPDCALFLDLDVVVDGSDFAGKIKAKNKNGVDLLSAKGKLPLELIVNGWRRCAPSSASRPKG